jgi:predicted nucleic acid-binding protein
VGLTVVDAGVLIAVLDPADAHHASCLELFRRARNDGDQLSIPASAYAESLVGPIRRGSESVARFAGFVSSFPVNVAPIDVRVAELAAGLRARHAPGLKLPDALVIATAQALEADLLVTTDRGWPTEESLDIPARILQL